MPYIIIIITLFILTFLRIFFKNKNLKSQNTRFNLRQPAYYLYVGLLGCFMSTFILAISIYQEGYMGLFFLIPLLPFVLASVWLILFQKNWQVRLEHNTLVYTNCFKKSKQLKLKKLKIKTLSSRYDIIYNNKCILKISYMLQSSSEFIKEIRLQQNKKEANN